MKKLDTSGKLLLAILILFCISSVYGLVRDRINSGYIVDKKYMFTYLYESTDWASKTWEQAHYTKFMYDLIDTFSSRNIRQSMGKEERINYARVNYKLAKGFNTGLFDVPIFHILETALNPKLIGKYYGEVGMGHYWYGTARDYYFYAKDRMPTDLWRLVRFQLNKPSDLQDSINSLKMGYIFLWREKKTYKGLEAWYVPAVRWGRFFYKHWEDGKGDLPIRFVIVTTLYGVKKYNARAYYWAWRNMRLAFEKGDLNTGLVVYRKWKRKGDKLKKDWLKYRDAYYVIRKQREIIEGLIFFESLNIEEKKRAQQEYKDLYVKMKRLGIDVREKGWSEKMREWLDRLIKKIK